MIRAANTIVRVASVHRARALVQYATISCDESEFLTPSVIGRYRRKGERGEPWVLPFGYRRREPGPVLKGRVKACCISPPCFMNSALCPPCLSWRLFY